MGCTKSKANKLEDKIALVMTIYEDILNEIKEKRQQYLGKCGDLEDNNDHYDNHDENEYQKKNTMQSEKSYSAQNSQRSTVIFTSKKSLEAAEIERKKTKADVWRFSSSMQQDVAAPTSRFRNKSIIKAEEFKEYMLFLKEINSKFEKIKSNIITLISKISKLNLKNFITRLKQLRKRKVKLRVVLIKFSTKNSLLLCLTDTMLSITIESVKELQ